MKKSLVLFALSALFTLGVVNPTSAALYNCTCLDGSAKQVSICDCPGLIGDENCCESLCKMSNPPSQKTGCSVAGDLPINNATQTPAQKETPNTPTVYLGNPLGSITSPQILIGKIINSVLSIVGSLALLMFVFGGLTWMTSSGNPEKVKKGRDIIVWSAIGLAVIFMAYALTRFVLSTIVK
jgi:hypothetical protein